MDDLWRAYSSRWTSDVEATSMETRLQGDWPHLNPLRATTSLRMTLRVEHRRRSRNGRSWGLPPACDLLEGRSPRRAEGARTS